MRIYCFFLLFLILNIYTNAQSKLVLSIGGGYNIVDLEDSKVKHWKNGYLINICTDYFVMNNLSLFINTSFQNKFLDGKLLKPTIDGITNYKHYTAGNDSYLYEFSVGGHFYDKHSFITPYLSIGVGILIISQGKIETTFWYDGYENSRTTIVASYSNNKYFMGQVTVGIGSEIYLSNNLKIIIEGKLYRTLVEGPSFIPLIISLKIGL